MNNNDATDSIRIVKNYLYNLSYQVLAIIVPLITTPYISRILHAEGVGIFSYTNTIATIFSLFATLGINLYGQREIAYHQTDLLKKSEIFWELIITRTGTTALISILYFAFVTINKKYQMYLFLQYFTIVSIMVDISWFFQGIENFKIIAVRNTTVKIITICSVFILVKKETDLGIYILINALSSLLSGMIMFANLRAQICKVSVNKLHFKRHFKGIFEFFLPVLAVQLYYHVDKIMLGTISNHATENGYYEQSRKIVELVVRIIVSLNAILSSRIAFLYARGEKDKICTIFQNSFQIIIMMVCPLIVGLYLISDNFVIWFFGYDFLNVSSLLKLSCPLIIFMCLGNFAGVQYLNPTKQQNKATIIYFISAVVNITFNCLLIPKYFSVGAMIASNIAEFCSCALQLYLLKKSIYCFKLTKGIHFYVIATIGMGVGVWLIDYSVNVIGVIKTCIQIGTGAIIYIGILILLKEQNIMFVLKKLRSFLAMK